MLRILQLRWQRPDKLVVRRLRQQCRLPAHEEIGALLANHLLDRFPQLSLGGDLIGDAEPGEAALGQDTVSTTEVCDCLGREQSFLNGRERTDIRLWFA